MGTKTFLLVNGMAALMRNRVMRCFIRGDYRKGVNNLRQIKLYRSSVLLHRMMKTAAGNEAMMGMFRVVLRRSRRSHLLPQTAAEDVLEPGE